MKGVKQLNKVIDNKYVIKAALILFVLVILAALLVSTADDNKRKLFYQVGDLNDGWYYELAGERILVDFPEQIESDAQTITFYHDIDPETYSGTVISSKLVNYKAVITLNDKVLYQYNDTGFKYNEQMNSKLHCDAELGYISGEASLSITLCNDGSNIFKIPDIIVGSGESIFIKHLLDEALPLGIVGVLSVLWIVSLIVGINLKLLHATDQRLFDILAFIFICDIWVLTDSALFHQMINGSPWGKIISFYAFMTFSIPMLKLVKHTGDMKRYKVLDVYVYLFIINAILQGMFNLYGIFEFVDMLFVTHLILFTGVAMLIYILHKENNRKSDNQLNVTMLAITCLGASGVISILLYWLQLIKNYEVLFECGVLICISIFCVATFKSTIDGYKLRTEMEAYKKMANEDQLTGLQNRRAYESFLKEIQPKVAEYDNAALIYLDVNNLKKINDTYGHSMGDEVIIRAANCVKEAFLDWGHCYRIGGDEFCVIILNPKLTEEEYLEIFDQTVAAANCGDHMKISVAKGISLIKDAKGELKSFSNWKYEADMQMYKQKQKEGGRS